MSVQDAVRTVTVPRQAEPADPPLTSAAPPPAAPPRAGVIGRDRPLTKDEREFVLMTGGVFGALSVIIVTFLLLAQYVWV